MHIFFARQLDFPTKQSLPKDADNDFFIGIHVAEYWVQHEFDHPVRADSDYIHAKD